MTEPMRDIRELKDDPDAYRDELTRRWSGLLSYRYIGRNHSSMNLGPEDNTVRIRHDMRNEAGGIMVAPLAIASPEGGQADLVAVPNPVIASVQMLDPGFDVQTIEVVDSGLLHQGRTMGYGRCRIVDAENPERVIAFIDGQGASIGTPPEGLERMDVEESQARDRGLARRCRRSGRSSGPPGGPTATGSSPSSRPSSPRRTRHCTSGPSTSCSSRPLSIWPPTLAGTRSFGVQSWHVMFLARGKVGPFRVDGSAYPAPGGKVGVRLLIHDEGNGDRAITSGSAVLAVLG